MKGFFMQIPRWLLVIGSLVIALTLIYLGKVIYLHTFLKTKNIERTLAIIKPDAVQAKCSGKIIDRAEQEGFLILALKKMQLTKEQAEKFYEIHKDRIFYRELIEFMLSGPIIVMVLEKENAIKAWRELLGNTDPKQATEGTLRNLYGSNISKNAVHGSDGPETAKTEIAFFFPELI